jgi:hypothetical protein
MSLHALMGRLREPTRLAATVWGIYLGPLAAGVIFYVAAVRHGAVFDFTATIYAPGKDVLAGNSPYPAAQLSALTGHPTFVYPPTMLGFDVPLALLPLDAARVVWALACFAAVAGALRLLGVGDPRCYALALLCVPAIQGLAMGNVTVFLVLPLALAWRYRDHPVAGGLAVGSLVAIKLLMWPLFVWLLVTRRVKTAVLAGVVGATAVLGAWALIGFKGMTEYPTLLHLVGDETAGPRALTVTTLAKSLGLPHAAGHGLQWALGLLLLALAAQLSRGVDGDRRAFSVVVAAGLVLTPVAWPHYFLFLLVPIALLERRLAPAWGVLWGFWLIVFLPAGETHHVFEGARDFGAFGVVPSVPRLILVLGLLALTILLTAERRAVRAAA